MSLRHFSRYLFLTHAGSRKLITNTEFMKLSPTIIALLDSLGRSTETVENQFLLQAIDEAIDQAINDEVATLAMRNSSSVMSDEAFLELIPASTYFH